MAEAEQKNVNPPEASILSYIYGFMRLPLPAVISADGGSELFNPKKLTAIIRIY